jgi:hypothetical protein
MARDVKIYLPSVNDLGFGYRGDWGTNLKGYGAETESTNHLAYFTVYENLSTNRRYKWWTRSVRPDMKVYAVSINESGGYAPQLIGNTN